MPTMETLCDRDGSRVTPAYDDGNRPTLPRLGFVVERPHELLGLSPYEADSITIIEAARRRLVPLRASAGSHREVRFFAIKLIIAARDAMLREAAGCRRDHDALGGMPGGDRAETIQRFLPGSSR